MGKASAAIEFLPAVLVVQERCITLKWEFGPSPKKDREDNEWPGS